MTEEPATESVTDQEHHTGVFRGLFVSVIEAARTRLDLAAVEAEIFVLRTIQMLFGHWPRSRVVCWRSRSQW